MLAEVALPRRSVQRSCSTKPTWQSGTRTSVSSRPSPAPGLSTRSPPTETCTSSCLATWTTLRTPRASGSGPAVKSSVSPSMTWSRDAWTESGPPLYQPEHLQTDSAYHRRVVEDQFQADRLHPHALRQPRFDASGRTPADVVGCSWCRSHPGVSDYFEGPGPVQVPSTTPGCLGMNCYRSGPRPASTNTVCPSRSRIRKQPMGRQPRRHG